MSVLHWTGGLLSVATLFGLTAAPARDRVVAVVPQSAAVFAAIGLPVNLDRLEIGPVQATLRSEDGRQVLVVESDIGNRHDTSLPLPPLRVSVRDAAGLVVYAWTPSPGAKAVAAHAHVPFRARLTAPPAGHDVVVEFARLAV